jgi:hypothetical protein
MLRALLGDLLIFLLCREDSAFQKSGLNVSENESIAFKKNICISKTFVVSTVD